jgi:two-component system response regulator (stage 0 sporulation protein F)
MAKVLVVDDERHIRECYSLELSDAGHEVVTAQSCCNLLKKIELIRPDAIILDIRLGDCDGLEMLESIRSCFHDIPIILCSAYDSYKNDISTIAADYYVIKSFDLTELKTKLDRALQADSTINLKTG